KPTPCRRFSEQLIRVGHRAVLRKRNNLSAFKYSRKIIEHHKVASIHTLRNINIRANDINEIIAGIPFSRSCCCRRSPHPNQVVDVMVFNQTRKQEFPKPLTRLRSFRSPPEPCAFSFMEWPP